MELFLDSIQPYESFFHRCLLPLISVSCFLNVFHSLIDFHFSSFSPSSLATFFFVSDPSIPILQSPLRSIVLIFCSSPAILRYKERSTNIHASSGAIDLIARKRIIQQLITPFKLTIYAHKPLCLTCFSVQQQEV